MLLPSLIVARLVRARLVYDTHELALGVPYRSGLLARLVERLERVALPRCSGVIVASEPIADRLKDHYGLRWRPIVLHNLCDLPRVLATDGAALAGDGVRRRLGVGDAPLIIHQGAATEGRGCAALVNALKDLEGSHVVFLGDSDPTYLTRLSELAVAAGVNDRVHFLPSVPPESLLAHTSEADVGVSLLEDTCENHRLTVPNKLFEYVAAGVPVVTSALPGLEQMVNRYSLGWTVNVESPNALARTLRTALDDRDNDEWRRHLAAVDRELSWPNEGRRLIELYDRLSA
jgi:glycosyltransferase involved in cell wall biosynthesis